MGGDGAMGGTPAGAPNNAKQKRYDRQLRIWGPHGQQRLESCRVCLLNCGPTGSEALKNLVLGGIHSFTIVDGAKVSANDLGNNFMVEASSLGEPRAKVCTELLNELNDSVAGSYIEESPETMIDNNSSFFAQFNVVVATQVGLLLADRARAFLPRSDRRRTRCLQPIYCLQMREPELIKLDEICREHRVLLVAVRSYGLMGMLRVGRMHYCPQLLLHFARTRAVTVLQTSSARIQHHALGPANAAALYLANPCLHAESLMMRSQVCRSTALWSQSQTTSWMTSGMCFRRGRASHHAGC